MDAAVAMNEGSGTRRVLQVEWLLSTPVAVEIRQVDADQGGDESYPWETCFENLMEDIVEVT